MLDAVRPRRQIPVVLASSVLLSFTSASRAAALALPELVFAAFFVGAVAAADGLRMAPWIVLAATVLAVVVRRLDVESWTLFIPGGLAGRVEHAYGARVANATVGLVLVERILLASLAAAVFGQYAAALLFALVGSSGFLRRAATADVSAALGVFLIGWLWLRARLGRLLTPARRARHVWASIGVLAALLAWALVTVIVRGAWPVFPSLSELTAPITGSNWRDSLTGAIALTVALVATFGRAAPAIGVADSIRRV